MARRYGDTGSRDDFSWQAMTLVGGADIMPSICRAMCRSWRLAGENEARQQRSGAAMALIICARGDARRGRAAVLPMAHGLA